MSTQTEILDAWEKSIRLKTGRYDGNIDGLLEHERVAAIVEAVSSVYDKKLAIADQRFVGLHEQFMRLAAVVEKMQDALKDF